MRSVRQVARIARASAAVLGETSLLRTSLIASSVATHSSSIIRPSVRLFSSNGLTTINVPGMGDSITNGTIVGWQKKKR